ncbi:hypothetical protein [Tissierella praeacuta]|uniref:hypothetical protein n=1 Tax=Tissierella praeacuta TaxID=43131 RepID=UPI00333F104B
MDKDRLGNELKIIMEDEVKEIEISQGLRDRILISRKKTLKDRIKDFLNKEIELPLVPMMASFIIFFIIVGIPKDIVVKSESIIDLGSTQIIIRDERRVSRCEN